MEPCPGADFCGVHVAEVGDGEPPKPPSNLHGDSTKGAGHGALGSKDRVLSRPASDADQSTTSQSAPAASAQTDAGDAEDDAAENEDQDDLVAGSRKRKSRSWRDKGARVPCPHDPRHTIYERELARHMLSCPTYTRQLEMEAQPFFSRNLNLCPDDPRKQQAAASAVVAAAGPANAEEEEREEEELRAGIVNPNLDSMLRKELTGGVDLKGLAARIGQAYAELVGPLRTELLCPDSCRDLLEGRILLSAEAVNPQRGQEQAGSGQKEEVAQDDCAEQGEGGGGRGENLNSEGQARPGDGTEPRVPVNLPGFRQLRHVEQQASIVGHMHARGLLEDGLTYVEMGAGRGMLSLTLRHAAPNAKLVFIERSGCRNKADRQLRGLESEGMFSRIRMDIAHLDMWGVDVVRDDQVVGIGKHLCGEATDLALRCLLGRGDGGGAKGHGRVRGVAIATCCHHRCHPLSYINRPFARKVLELCGLGGEGRPDMDGFSLLQLMTSWACCCCGVVSEKVEGRAGEAAQSLSREEREVVGRQCKRLLDMGRAVWLREQGLEAELVHFCARETSPENCLLLAWAPAPRPHTA